MLHKLILGTTAALALATAAQADEALLSMNWDDIVAQAREEGQVTWYVWYFEPEFRAIVADFESEYGITVTIPDVNAADDVLNKIIAEQGLDATEVDLIAMGGSTALRIDPTELFMGPFLPVLPEAAARRDKIEGGDWQGHAVQFWGNQTGIGYDPDRVTEAELPQTIEQLEAWMAGNPGMFGFNFENGGSGPSLIHNVARNILGVTMDSTVTETPDLQPVYDWFIANEDNYVITASNADSITRMNAGEFSMIAVWEDHIGGLIRRGEVADRFKVYVPEFGMNGGGNVVAIPRNAANPAAAMVLAEWLSSAAIQTRFNAEFGTAPANAGADASFALIPVADRANQTVWGAPLPSGDVVPAMIENVFQR
jgi:putative spermidine/putrescine transport system substrate-binding protein